jgi:hypothetical protein
MTTLDDDGDTPIWGVKAIGEVLGRSPRQTFHLLKHKRIDADKSGHLWVSTPRRLLSPFQKPKKEGTE